MAKLSGIQRTALVLLRTLVGWHFLYEGYYKLMVPGWSRDGQLLAHWSAAGYLKAASGPLGSLFHSLAASAASGWIDRLVPIGLTAVGLSLMLGFLTQLGCWGALAFLTLFYFSAIPTAGVPQPGAEGTYLFVNKNLVEAGAVLVIAAFRTGAIAGLDVLRATAARKVAQPDRAAAPDEISIAGRGFPPRSFIAGRGFPPRSFITGRGFPPRSFITGRGFPPRSRAAAAASREA